MSLLPDHSDRRLHMRRVHTSFLPDNSNRLRPVWLVQTYRPHKSTSLLLDNADRLLRVRLVQTYPRHKSPTLLPDSSHRLPLVMILLRVQM